MTFGRSVRISSERPRGGRRARLFLVALTIALAAAALSTDSRAERFECLVEPYVEVDVSSAVPGILDTVSVDRGDMVEQGQVLATLVSKVERAQFDLAKAKLEFAERKVQRNKELYRKQMISSHEKDELETEAHLLKLQLREAEAQLELRTIRSPLSGVVVKRDYSPGEFVLEQPILSLAQIDPLRVEVAVPVRLYGRIKAGSVANVEWEAPLGRVVPATVTIVDPVVDAASGTIGVRLELPNADHRLPAGTKCYVRLPAGS